MAIEDHPYGKAFLDAIKKDRYDERSRKIFADWLEEKGFDSEAAEQRKWTRERQEAEDWLRELATRLDYGSYYEYEPNSATFTYEQVIEMGYEYIRRGSYCFGDTQGPNVMDGETKELFWKYWQIITEVDVSTDIVESDEFRCAC